MPESERKPSDLSIRMHPAERRRRSAVIAPCACCSCCCCCLHSVGGLLGAAAASGSSDTKRPHEQGYADPDENAWLTGARVYWLTLCFLLGCVFLGSVLYNLSGRNPTEGFLVGAAINVMLLPAVQLAASLVASFVIGVAPVPDRPAAYRKLGKITAWMFLGTLIGGGLMALVCIPFAAR